MNPSGLDGRRLDRSSVGPDRRWSWSASPEGEEHRVVPRFFLAVRWTPVIRPAPMSSSRLDGSKLRRRAQGLQVGPEGKCNQQTIPLASRPTRGGCRTLDLPDARERVDQRRSTALTVCCVRRASPDWPQQRNERTIEDQTCYIEALFRRF